MRSINQACEALIAPIRRGNTGNWTGSRTAQISTRIFILNIIEGFIMKHRLFWYAGLLVTLLSIGGCGGGGGGGGAGGGGSPAASLALFAGDMGGPGNVDGTGPAARFNGPQGVAADSAGNVYVADTNNNTIRKITPAGDVTTLAGTAGVTGSTDDTGAKASFNSPSGVAADSAGNVYVADTGNNTIRKITPAGDVTTLAGTAGVT